MPTIQCKVWNSTGKKVEMLHLWHRSASSTTPDKPPNNGSITLQPGDWLAEFELNIDHSDDYWTLAFSMSKDSSGGGSIGKLADDPSAAGAAFVRLTYWWSRINKQCNVTYDDCNTGQPVIINLMYGDDGWSVDLPYSLSSNCPGNYYDGPASTFPDLPSGYK